MNKRKKIGLEGEFMQIYHPNQAIVVTLKRCQSFPPQPALIILERKCGGGGGGWWIS